MEEKNCSQCGAALTEGAGICKYCGAVYAQPAAESAAPSQPQPVSTPVPPNVPPVPPPYSAQIPYTVPVQAPYQPVQQPYVAAPNGQPYGVPFRQPYMMPQAPVDPAAQKSKLIAGLLGIFLGALGIHNFYLGYKGKGVGQLLVTLLSCFVLSPVSWVWGLVEGIQLLTGNVLVDARNIPLKD